MRQWKKQLPSCSTTSDGGNYRWRKLQQELPTNGGELWRRVTRAAARLGSWRRCTGNSRSFHARFPPASSHRFDWWGGLCRLPWSRVHPRSRPQSHTKPRNMAASHLRHKHTLIIASQHGCLPPTHTYDRQFSASKSYRALQHGCLPPTITYDRQFSASKSYRALQHGCLPPTHTTVRVPLRF